MCVYVFICVFLCMWYVICVVCIQVHVGLFVCMCLAVCVPGLMFYHYSKGTYVSKKKNKKTQIIVKLDNVLYDEKWSLRIKIYKKLENITFLSGSLRQKQLNSLFHGLNLLWFLASPFDNNTDFTYTHFFFLLFVFSNISFF